MAVAGAAASVRVVVTLKAATVCAASVAASIAASTAAASPGYCGLYRHLQLNSYCLGAAGGRETVRRVPHVTLPDEGSEGGVQAR